MTTISAIFTTTKNLQFDVFDWRKERSRAWRSLVFKILKKSINVVNFLFTCSFYTRRRCHKRKKKVKSPVPFFAFLGSSWTKFACKTSVKLTYDQFVRYIQKLSIDHVSLHLIMLCKITNKRCKPNCKMIK